MMKTWIGCAFLCTGLAFACGSSGDTGSGVDGDKPLVELESGEITSLCTYLVAVAGPERVVDCGDGVTFTVGGQEVADCVDGFTESQTEFPTCAATVDNIEGCSEGIAALSDEQLCSEEGALPAACAPLFTAECGGL